MASDVAIIAFISGVLTSLSLLHTYRQKSVSDSTSGFSSLVGRTKLVYLRHLSDLLGCRIFGKAEFLNPGGSVKDRVAIKLVSEARKRGCDTVIEATSGSTGISLALACKEAGLKLKIVMPDDVSEEKIKLIKVLGADVQLVRPVSIADPNHMCKIAEKFAQLNPNCFYTNQFENLVNFDAHYEGTACEILQDLPEIDVFVASAGTGATIAGVASKIKRLRTSSIQTILADVQGSALATRVNTGVMFNSLDREGFRVKHPYDTITEGVGLNRLTENFRKGIKNIDHAVHISDQEAVDMAHYLLQSEGLFLGSSSAVNVAGVVKAFKQGLIRPGSTVVTILCDTGMRHLSKFWSESYLKERGLLPRRISPLDFIA